MNELLSAAEVSTFEIPFEIVLMKSKFVCFKATSWGSSFDFGGTFLASLLSPEFTGTSFELVTFFGAIFGVIVAVFDICSELTGCFLTSVMTVFFFSGGATCSSLDLTFSASLSVKASSFF